MEPTTRADGRVLRRYRIRGTELVLTEDPMDRTFQMELIEVKPIPMPTASVFYRDFNWPQSDE